MDGESRHVAKGRGENGATLLGFTYVCGAQILLYARQVISHRTTHTLPFYSFFTVFFFFFWQGDRFYVAKTVLKIMDSYG